MTYKEEMELTWKFFDTIDFEQFISDDKQISVDDLMDSLEEYYDKAHPDQLPPEFQGCLFNFVNDTEFTDYLHKRYGFPIVQEVVERYYLLNRKTGEPMQQVWESKNRALYKKEFPCILGQPAEMLVDGVWQKGKIVEGYRFDDGIVTIETAEGKRFWCGQSRTDIYRPLEENT